METDGVEYVGQSNSIDESQTAVNKLILDYYKKFGRKRDLEQFFSLSTVQNDIRDPSFWRKMKSQTDSDSGEKKSESSTELCRISIKCSIPEPSTSQEHYHTIKSESESPPIIRDEDPPKASQQSDNESIKSDDNYSHKSADGTLDTSVNKPHSPTSSITSQRRLEWDSLADVGYANESDRKNSASSLSTLERLALQQQYSNNDTKHSEIGQPTAQSTPLDINELKSKKASKKTTKIYKKDIDSVELNICQNENIPQPINVNLTKHISFNVEKDGGVTIENVTKSVSMSPEKVSVETEVTPQAKTDKEIQTTLTKNEKTSSSSDLKEQHTKRFPILISLNTLKKRTRKKKVRRIKRNPSKAKVDKKATLEKSTEQLSEAESFEYMPGHIYNQNQLINDPNRNNNGNKSSLESTGVTTDSSKTTKYSFSKDLETGIDILKAALDNRYEDSRLKKQLIKEVVQRLIKSKYKGDESSTEFLSGLSFDSKKLDFSNHTTSSASDVNTVNKAKQSKPKKSILRMDKFNSSAIASTSQSVPNLPAYSKSENPLKSTKKLTDSNTDSESSKNKNLSDTHIDKTSSEVLYKKYLEALKREEAYRKHLKNKEMFLKQKLVSSDLAFNATRQVDNAQNNLKGLMKDLIRNNYDDGSGDASKLEGGSNTNSNIEKYNSIRKHKSHSVFTLSSSNSDKYKKKPVSNKSPSKECSKSSYKTEKHYCCCLYHSSHPHVAVTDSSVQVDMKIKSANSPDIDKSYREFIKENITCEKCIGQKDKGQIVSDCAKEDIKYVCLCTGDKLSEEVPENILIYKCSRLANNSCRPSDNILPKQMNIARDQFASSSTSPGPKISTFHSDDCDRKCLTIKDNQTSKSSQTNVNLPIKLQSKSSEQSMDSSLSGEKISSYRTHSKKLDSVTNGKKIKIVHEATRWIQTEISIDPKISDPSLTDINIVNDENCVKLISEQHKEVSQPTSVNNVLKHVEKNNTPLRSVDSSSSGSYSVENKDSEKSLNIYKSVKETATNTIEKLDKQIQSSPISTISKTSMPVIVQSPKNFTIPIQGTNMTLKVSVGSEIGNVVNEKKTVANDIPNTISVSKGTDAIKSDVVENYTSLQEECSKGVQSINRNMFNESQTPKNASCDIPNTQESSKTDRSENFRKQIPSNVNACLISASKYNTYPNVELRNANKPLLRSNTDTDKIEKICHVTFNKTKLASETQPATRIPSRKPSTVITTDTVEDKELSCSGTSFKNNENSDQTNNRQPKTSSSETDSSSKTSLIKDPLLDMIQDITRRYSKKDIEKSKRKKCYKDIIRFLNYLLDTDDNSDRDKNKTPSSESENVSNTKNSVNKIGDSLTKKTFVDKGIQLSDKTSISQKTCTESSEQPISTEVPSTSTDSATCKILNKIKRECDKYHQKRCKCHGKDKCEASSSTSVNCDQCRRVHHCSCRHRCKSHKNRSDKKKKCVAYNLIIQTSESIVSEEIPCDNRRKLQNIIVKVPSKRNVDAPFKEVATNIEKDMPHRSPRCNRIYRLKSLPNDSEISSTDDILKKSQAYTVRDYLEKNRPDFIQKCSKRQNCLKVINETRASERSAKRQLLSLQLDRQQALSALSENELKAFARQLGEELRRKKVAPKFISEREMKKHSEKIYKSLPEVVRKKEEIKKENIKKTNLLMANIFKKNLQKKTLQGAVNLSNYSTVIKI